jgi:hypothetical protein
MTPTHRITTTAAAILTLAAAAGTPTAAAGSSDASVATASHQKPATVYSRQDKSLIPVASWTSDDGVSAAPAAVRIETPPSGFDWGDAAVGAAGGFALSMIAVGGVLAVSQRRDRRPISPQASRVK